MYFKHTKSVKVKFLIVVVEHGFILRKKKYINLNICSKSFCVYVCMHIHIYVHTWPLLPSG